MLTAKSDEADIVYGFGIGADDYVVKPFRMKELVARIYARHKAVIHKDRLVTDIKSEYGIVQVVPELFKVNIGTSTLLLSPAEFRLFEALFAVAGTVLTRERLLDAVGGLECHISDRNIDVHIAAIRKKLGSQADLIQTVRGFGYKMTGLRTMSTQHSTHERDQEAANVRTYQ